MISVKKASHCHHIPHKDCAWPFYTVFVDGVSPSQLCCPDMLGTVCSKGCAQRWQKHNYLIITQRNCVSSELGLWSSVSAFDYYVLWMIVFYPQVLGKASFELHATCLQTKHPMPGLAWDRERKKNRINSVHLMQCSIERGPNTTINIADRPLTWPHLLSLASIT